MYFVTVAIIGCDQNKYNGYQQPASELLQTSNDFSFAANGFVEARRHQRWSGLFVL
jgi:hypothetical protein